MPWLIAGLLIVIIVVAVLYSANKRSQPEIPRMANAGNAAGAADDPSAGGLAGGRAPDISSMSPKERFVRLEARITDALQRGDSATVISFTPMALGAYAQLPDSNRDIDARYHAAMLQAQVGMLDQAKALADTILREAPNNLFGYYVRANVAEFGGDSAQAKAARAAFRSHYNDEIKKKRPEYAEHRPLLEDYFKNGGAQ